MNGKNAINSNFLNNMPPEHIIIGVLVLIILYLMFYQDNKISYDDTYNTSCNSSSNEHFTNNLFGKKVPKFNVPAGNDAVPAAAISGLKCKRKAEIPNMGTEYCAEWEPI